MKNVEKKKISLRLTYVINLVSGSCNKIYVIRKEPQRNYSIKNIVFFKSTHTIIVGTRFVILRYIKKKKTIDTEYNIILKDINL